MIKYIKGLFCTAIVTGLIFYGTTAGFARLTNFSYTGEIKNDDLKIYVSVPTLGSSTLVIKPYGKEQITTEPQAFQNISSGENAITYDVKLIGYTATSSMGNGDSFYFRSVPTAADEYSGKAKKAYCAIQIGSSTVSDPTAGGNDAFETCFNDPAVNITVTKKAEEDYSPGSDVYYYKLGYAGYTVTLKSGEYAPIRVTGTVNPNSEWEESDEIHITPVFNIVPNLTD